MNYLLDTADIETIQRAADYLPVSGVTSNPSIVKEEGRIDFFAHMRTIRKIIGITRSLHIQVTATSADGILRDADALLEKVDPQVYIKIPVTLEGLRAIKLLKQQGKNVTATGIYTINQGLLAMEAGADYLAPYYNRMESLNLNPEEAISFFTRMIELYGYQTKVVAASFKNIGQVNRAFMAGAQAATLNPALIEAALAMPDITKAVEEFSLDWQSIYGDKLIADL